MSLLRLRSRYDLWARQELADNRYESFKISPKVRLLLDEAEDVGGDESGGRGPQPGQAEQSRTGGRKRVMRVREAACIPGAPGCSLPRPVPLSP